MSNLEVKGTQEFMGREIPIVCGGFGKGQKVVLAKTIAEIHGMEVKHVNELINRSANRFKGGIDLLDLKVVVQNDHNLLREFGFTQMQISKANNIYLLSERGYAKLIKIMDSDLAWEIHDKLIDEYFTMREERRNPYGTLSKELQAIFIIDKKQQEFDQRLTKLENNMTIDYNQQEILRCAISTRVYQLLGSAKENDKLRAKVFSALHRFIRNTFSVNSYKNIAIIDFEHAKVLIQTWMPDEIITLAIQGAQGQMRLTV